METLHIVNSFINMIIPFVIALIVLVGIIGFIIGIVLFIRSLQESDPKTKNRFRIWAVVCIFGPIAALFLFVTIWGLVNIIDRSFTGLPMETSNMNRSAQ